MYVKIIKGKKKSRKERVPFTDVLLNLYSGIDTLKIKIFKKSGLYLIHRISTYANSCIYNLNVNKIIKKNGREISINPLF